MLMLSKSSTPRSTQSTQKKSLECSAISACSAVKSSWTGSRGLPELRVPNPIPFSTTAPDSPASPRTGRKTAAVAAARGEPRTCDSVTALRNATPGGGFRDDQGTTARGCRVCRGGRHRARDGHRIHARRRGRLHALSQLRGADRGAARADQGAREPGEARRSRENARGPHGLGDRDWQPCRDAARRASGAPHRRQSRRRSGHRQRARAVCRRGTPHRICGHPGDQSAARRQRLLHPATRQPRRGGVDVCRAQDGPQDQRLEVRQRQRRPPGRGWPGRSEQGRRHLDDARQGSARALHDQSRRSPSDAARRRPERRARRLRDLLGGDRRRRRWILQ